MKKIIFWVTMFSLLTTARVYAAVGDIAGDIYTTDIMTEVDSLPIESFSLDGKTLIVLEDLENYGFTVYYNDNIRTLFVTKTGEPAADFNPSFPRGEVGEISGNYYETDIKAYVNGHYVKSYALNGKLAACVEDIGSLENHASENIMSFKKKLADYSYDDSERLLKLYTDVGGEEAAAENVSEVLNANFYPWKPTYKRVLHNDTSDIWVTEATLGGLPHGATAYYFNVTLPNGLQYNAYSIGKLYYLNLSEPILSKDGEWLYCINHTDIGDEYKQMNLRSMEIKPLDYYFYNDAKSNVADSEFSVKAFGVEIPLYNIGGRDYIRAADLTACGCRVHENTDKSKLDVLYLNEVNGEISHESINSNVMNEVCLLNSHFNGRDLESDDVYIYNGNYYIPVYSLTNNDGRISVGHLGNVTTYCYDLENKQIVIENHNCSDEERAAIHDNDMKVLMRCEGNGYEIHKCKYNDNIEYDNTEDYRYQIHLITDDYFIVDLMDIINKYIAQNGYESVSVDKDSVTTISLDKENETVDVKWFDKGEVYQIYQIDLKTWEVSKKSPDTD